MHKQMTDAIRMSQNGHTCHTLNLTDQLRATARYHEIDAIIAAVDVTYVSQS